MMESDEKIAQLMEITNTLAHDEWTVDWWSVVSRDYDNVFYTTCES